MKTLKQKLGIVLLSFSSTIFAQVGINTINPASTLDITAKNASGTSTTVDGLLIARVDRLRAQSMTGITTSTLIYINDISNGSQTNTAINIDAVGYYYFNGTAWVKLHNPNNIINLNIYNSNGTLTTNRVVSQGNNTLTFTGTAVNSFSINGNTFSVDATNNRVGIGTATPTNRLHISATTAPLRLQGVDIGNSSTDQLLVIDATGIVKNIGTLGSLSIPTPAIFRLETAQTDFLNGISLGSSSIVPMSLLKNSINGMSYNAATSVITFPAGTYQITFVYEATHNNTNGTTVDADMCRNSSYIVDFPSGASGTQRIHSTAYHNAGGTSNHGGSITYTTTLPAGRTWPIRLGRGQSGNCTGTGMRLIDLSTQLLVFRIGD